MRYFIIILLGFFIFLPAVAKQIDLNSTDNSNNPQVTFDRSSSELPPFTLPEDCRNLSYVARQLAMISIELLPSSTDVSNNNLTSYETDNINLAQKLSRQSESLSKVHDSFCRKGR